MHIHTYAQQDFGTVACQALASVNEDASAPRTREWRDTAPLVRPHGALVEPRGRQRVKVPSRRGSCKAAAKAKNAAI